MDSYDFLPKIKITSRGPVSKFFLDMGTKTFQDACLYVHHMPYGYNTNKNDLWALFNENRGSCTTKHGAIATLAQELGVNLKKNLGIYKFTEEICTGTQEILDKYQVPYIPMTHCFLTDGVHRFDLTEGNHNGKNRPLDHFIATLEVPPIYPQKDEYLWFKDVLKKEILLSAEMKNIPEKRILKAREEAILLLHSKVG